MLESGEVETRQSESREINQRTNWVKDENEKCRRASEVQILFRGQSQKKSEKTVGGMREEDEEELHTINTTNKRDRWSKKQTAQRMDANAVLSYYMG